MKPSSELLVVSDNSAVFAIEEYARNDIRLAHWNITVCHSLISALHIADNRAALGHSIDGLVSAVELMDGRGDTTFWLVSALHPQVRERTLMVATRAEHATFIGHMPAVEIVEAPDSAAALCEAICRFISDREPSNS